MEEIPDVNLGTWSVYDTDFGNSEGAVRLPVFVKIRELQINTGIEIIVEYLVWNPIRGIWDIEYDVAGIIKCYTNCESAGNCVGDSIHISFFLYSVQNSI